MKEIILAVVSFLLSITAFVISVRSFQEKGFLFNNAYLYASKQERERMDKKPYYRQSAVVFLLVGIIFLLLGLAELFHSAWMSFGAMGIAIAVGIYAIISSIAIERQHRNQSY